MKQQTPVEFAFDRLASENLLGIYTYDEMVMFDNIFNQAKEIEKAEKQNYLKAYFDWHKLMGFVSHKPEDIIEFNETYGGNK
jgi:hypothetical protein